MFSTLGFKKHRRRSETDRASASSEQSSSAATAEYPSPLNRVTSNTSSNRPRSRSHGGSKALSRTLSNTLSKRLSFFSNNSSDDLNSIVSSGSVVLEDDEPVTEELIRFRTLNQDRFPRRVHQFLKFHGLSAPKIVQQTANCWISVSASGEKVFLPSLISLTEEEQQNLELNSPNPIPSSSSMRPVPPIEENEQTHTPPPQQTTHHIDDSVDPIAHTFAVVVTLLKPTPILTIKTQLQAICSVQWPKGLPSDRNVRREDFELAQATWDLNLVNHSFFSALDDDDSEDPQESFMTEQKIPTKRVEHKSYDQVSRGGYANSKRDQDPFVIGALNSGTSINFSPGHYVFVLPTLFEPHLPESLLTTKSQVSYTLRTIVVEKSKTYAFGESYVPVIRAPPVSGITTADKPIFVSKVWNDTLSYEISFPRKYVTLGSELPMKLKFIPLEKKVTVKRIKVNVIEKVTYVAKSLEFEYDEHGNDLDEAYLQTNGNEKIIHLLEVRAKQRNSKAVREEVVEDAAVYDNLLSCCYQKPAGPEKSTDAEIVGPLTINTYVPFVKPQRPARFYPHCSKHFFNTVVHTDKNKLQASTAHKTRMSNQNYNVNIATKINQVEEGLLPDSSNNRYINIEHKLQICVRISKEDKDKKMHHYEVIIDTPVFLLNSCCVPESVELPPYSDMGHMERLPTFEESMSPMNSPVLMPYNEETLDKLSRTSTMTSTAGLDEYDNIDALVQGDSSEISLTAMRRRRSTATKTDPMSSFRRTVSNNQPLMDSGSSSGRVSEEMPESPPPYMESVALLSDESTGEVEVDADTTVQESIDLTEQFTRAVYGQE